MKLNFSFTVNESKKTSEVVINDCYGGYSLSYKAVKWLAEHGLKEAKEEISERKSYLDKEISGTSSYSEWLRERAKTHSIEQENFHLDLSRHHPLLVQCVKELGEEAGGMYSKLCSSKFCRKSVSN